jgi:methionyl-tRNA formyltransferase
LVEAGERVVAVVTQPDRPKGRGQKLTPTPVGAAAKRLGLAILHPERVNAPESVALLHALLPQFVVCVDYGQILRPELLAVGQLGAINVHPSLLPLHRGPSPVAGAILSGDTETGVTTMVMDEGMDSGPLLLQERIPLDPGMTTRGELSEALSKQGAALLVETLARLRAGTLTPTPQDASRATFTTMLDGVVQRIDWQRDATHLVHLVHALSPAPGARTWHKQKLLKVLRASVAEGQGEPGTVLATSAKGFTVATGQGAVLVREVLPEGKKAMDAGAFARGGGIHVGDRLDSLS